MWDSTLTGSRLGVYIYLYCNKFRIFGQFRAKRKSADLFELNALLQFYL